MLDCDDCPRQVHAGIGFFLNTQSTVGVIKKCHLGYFIVDDGDILGIIPALFKRNFDAAVPVGHKSTYGITVGADDLEQCPTNWNLGAGLILDDAQSGFILDGRTVRVVAVCGQLRCCSGVSIYHIILEFAIFIFLLTYRKKYSVLIDICVERQLDAAGLALHTFQRI